VNADADLATAAALIGDRARARMLLALLDGRPRAAGDLARQAGVSPATASQHLARLLDGGLLTVAADGRHRFYAIAGEQVAAAVETLAAISPRRPVRSLREATAGDLLHRARSCYDHLAGRLGVLVTDALVRGGAIGPVAAGEVGQLLDPAHPLLARLGLTLPVEPPPTRRPVVRGCLDWTERRPHLAGHLGASVLSGLIEHEWLRRRPADRALAVTPRGIDRLADVLELPVEHLRDASGQTGERPPALTRM
jgi:DNA-binding transcriptional ArsR family regulator